ncbi:hypothetical protein GN244_ATG05496 [Phytophthora infestans]|uniref:Uncharacterized protein n=1 Tax=Phytophthora infestans TaxID=4787 RepID=A0A833TET0_PHYIN|nr:hypothetical protein GN244_ATG05496 [Phytophthora infestans]
MVIICVVHNTDETGDIAYKTTMHWKSFQIASKVGSRKNDFLLDESQSRKHTSQSHGHEVQASEIIEISEKSSERQGESAAPPEPQDISQERAEETNILAIPQISAPPSQI